MNAVLAVAAREIRERRSIVISAIALAILPLFGALLPGAQTWGRAGMIAALGCVFSIGFTLLLSVTLGVTTIGRDLSENRLSFYFSRPISAAALWSGKALGCVLLILAGLAITATTPLSLLMGEARFAVPENAGFIAAAVITVPIIVFVASHVLSSMVRSRMPLILLDVLLAAGTFYLLWRIVWPYFTAYAFSLGFATAIGIGVLLTIVLFVAPVWQLSRGRVDRRRGHIELSKSLWTGVALVLALSAGFTTWVFAFTPSHLERLWGRELPGGDWIAVSGEARHRMEMPGYFLHRPANGASLRIGPPMQMVFSRSGDAAVWTESSDLRNPAGGEFRVRLAHLGETGRIVDTGLRGGYMMVLAVSEGGRRVATYEGSTLRVIDPDNDVLLASIRIPEGDASMLDKMYFDGEDHLRLIDVREEPQFDTVPLRIYSLDVARRALVKQGEARVSRSALISATADGSRLVIRDSEAPRILDGRSGADIGRLPLGTRDVLPLTDGTFAAAFFEKGRRSVIRVVDAGLHIRREVELPGIGYTLLEREVAPGQILISTAGGPRAWSAMTVDLAAGRVVRQADGIYPRFAGRRFDPRASAIDPRPGIYFEKPDSLVSWNALTGEKKQLF